MRGEHKANLFCAWCGRELGWRGGIVAYTLCADCVPLVKAHYEATRNAARALPESTAPAQPAPQRRRTRRAAGG
ncbi:MAG: hypothetical protein IT302_06220 [Dehalococcoidia bacterium]|nr:hypothetical protein [Dehalococcoidia bacterium]